MSQCTGWPLLFLIWPKQAYISRQFDQNYIVGKARHDLIVLFVVAALQKPGPKMIPEDFTSTEKRPFCFTVSIFLSERSGP